MATKIDAQGNAISSLGNGTSGQLLVGDGTAATLGTGLSMAGATLNAAGEGASTAYNVPDPTYWEDTGVVAPYSQGGVWRLGSTTYMFGGTNGTPTSKIYSATDNGSGAASTYTFADTGSTLPGAMVGARLFQVGASLYIVGSQSASSSVWTATMANPLSWSALTSLPGNANNANYFIFNGLVTIMSGDPGGGVGLRSNYTCPVGSIAAPTWTTTASPYSGTISCWEAFAYFSGGNLIQVCGTGPGGSAPSTDQRVYSPSSWPSLSSFTFAGMTALTTAEVFDLGDSVFVVSAAADSNAGTTAVYVIEKGNYVSPRQIYTLSAAQKYIWGARWIGRDGRAYFVQSDNRHIFRSGRKVAYTQQTSAANTATGLEALYADGKPTTISAHVLTGNPGWLQSP